MNKDLDFDFNKLSTGYLFHFCTAQNFRQKLLLTNGKANIYCKSQFLRCSLSRLKPPKRDFRARTISPAMKAICNENIYFEASMLKRFDV